MKVGYVKTLYTGRQRDRRYYRRRLTYASE